MTDGSAAPLFRQGSGVRLWRGRSGLLYHGAGEIHLARAPRIGLDSHLAQDLEQVADRLGLRLGVSSVDTGAHAPNSRHYRGLAVDISRIAPAGHDWEPVTGANYWARRLARTLAAAGFRHYEAGPWPCVLLGSPQSLFNSTGVDHGDHLHVSLWR